MELPAPYVPLCTLCKVSKTRCVPCSVAQGLSESKYCLLNLIISDFTGRLKNVSFVQSVCVCLSVTQDFREPRMQFRRAACCTSPHSSGCSLPSVSPPVFLLVKQRRILSRLVISSYQEAVAQLFWFPLVATIQERQQEMSPPPLTSLFHLPSHVDRQCSRVGDYTQQTFIRSMNTSEAMEANGFEMH